ncbi:MAG: hypothetical protein PHU69_10575 [Fermentimonas sp.]|nr:hypothetical protein [Fermentimonas sp.]
MINAFPGYDFVYFEDDKQFHNMYRGTDLGRGGYVYAEPGMWGDVALLDVQSMHPNSAVNLNIFGEFTQRFKDLLDARVAIKHRNFDKARKLMGGKLVPYLKDESQADALAQALKIAINSVYGLTSANFENPFKDNRNKNNIVALRGALFMKTLQDEVRERGFVVAHIKTDSIKIPDATPEIIQFVMDFGMKYDYVFEHEATYDKMCLVNNAVYIAKYASKEKCESLYGYIPGDNKKHPNEWTATGTQFQIPYVFKKLFSKEEIIFEDVCETKSVTSALYLDMNEGLPDVSGYEKELDKLNKTEISIEVDALNDMENKCKELEELIAEGHNYRFIGKVGRFCPIKEGCGGGLLMREKDGKYYAATGSKGYRWLESEMVSELRREADIDRSYYDKMVDEAVKSISNYGDFEWFISDDPYNRENNGILPF